VKSRRTQDWTASLLQPSDVNSAQKQSGWKTETELGCNNWLCASLIHRPACYEWSQSSEVSRAMRLWPAKHDVCCMELINTALKWLLFHRRTGLYLQAIYRLTCWQWLNINT
jgi:hypothetical protein